MAAELEAKEMKVNVGAICRQMGATRSHFYVEKKKREDQAVLLSDEIRSLRKQQIMQIIQSFSYIPGQRFLRNELSKRFDVSVSRKTISSMMKELGIISHRNYRSSIRVKNPYKGQATHEHPACALTNGVDQWFFREQPREIILTDITYLFYGLSETAYLATFKDACTKEILGWAVSDKMDTTSLIGTAYEMMMNRHKGEFVNTKEVLIHSDQGSQYLSTSFKELLSDDGFVQSMSRRGNSQDNAPMESFFAVLKSELSIVERCKDLAGVKNIIDGYMNQYNTERGQETIGWLAPADYYYYKKTGDFPLKTYFGVPEEDLMKREAFLKKKEEENRKRSEVRKSLRQLQGKEADIKSAADRVCADKGQILKALSYVERYEDLLHVRKNKLVNLLEDVEKAEEFIEHADQDVKKDLLHYDSWHKYRELDYTIRYSSYLDMATVFPQTIRRF